MNESCSFQDQEKVKEVTICLSGFGQHSNLQRKEKHFKTERENIKKHKTFYFKIHFPRFTNYETDIFLYKYFKKKSYKKKQ